MATEFRLPDVGEGIAEAIIVEWLIKEGDTVRADQIIVKVETDKSVAELPTPVSGKVLKVNFAKGDTVNVGAVLCVIGESGERIKTASTPQARKTESIKEEKIESTKSSKPEGKVLATPQVRRAAMENGIDLSTINGSGNEGQILMSDLNISSKEPKEEPKLEGGVSRVRKYDSFGYVERIPFKGIRKVIAQNMLKSLTQAAQVTTMADIDVTNLWAMRQREKEHFAMEGIKLTFLPFIIKGVVKALQKHPIVNSMLEGDEIVVKKYYNIGIAVQTDAGLMVPVLKIVEVKSIAEIAKEIEELANKAKNRTIDPMEMKGGTFTITNYGSVGGTYATPVINPPEAAILGLGKIYDRAVLDEKTNKLKNVKILPVSVTFDHQILDGAEATQFIESLREVLENPDETLLK